MRKEQIRKFYNQIWQQRDKGAIPELLRQDFVFRGSLGAETRGLDGFAAYVDQVHRGLDEYACEILDLVAEDDQVFARMLFSGIHNGPLFGFPATGRQVAWHGAALFTFDGDYISQAWVLGDLTTLRGQLAEPHR